MKYGMVRVGAYTPVIKVGNPDYNRKAIAALLKTAASDGVEIAVFPELCVTGYTCADLFLTRELNKKTVSAVKALAELVPENTVAVIGAPVLQTGRLYNCAIVLSGGKILGIVPKTELPDYGEFYEKRYFTSPAFDGVISSDDYGVPMGNVLFKCKSYPDLILGCEICEDMWVDIPPSVYACRAGATVIANLSASDEVVGKAEYRELLVKSISGRLHAAYIYADAGEGESSTDMVFSGHNIIAENGGVLDASSPFSGGNAVTDIDIERLIYERRKIGVKPTDKIYQYVEFDLDEKMHGKLKRAIERYPFVPADGLSNRAELILAMQVAGLKKRFNATKSNALVVGVSGGLDSALALLVCNRATDGKKIKAVTMPCFGTTERTKGNAEKLCAALGIEITTIDIKGTVTSHLSDIAHDKTDVVYENAQARVRTMTLFDIANKVNGLVVGTGDLSELALGWCTYNGDHMSSYAVNAGVPKTLVKHLIAYEAKRLGGEVKAVLDDILNTDISPELLPADNGKITQKTEDILGKYDLLDFIMYYYCRYGFTRKKIEFLLKAAFNDVEDEQLQKALDTFFNRFFMSQFKRSCLPDGVKIGSVSFSPRSDFRLPSDIEN